VGADGSGNNNTVALGASNTYSGGTAVHLASPEWQFDVIQGYYQHDLDRTGSAAEVNGWTVDFQGGLTDEQVQALVLGAPSQEFFHKVSG
jgi:hypothetical protein